VSVRRKRDGYVAGAEGRDVKVWSWS